MPSPYTKKTDRPKAYPADVIAAAVALADKTSINAASIKTGISTHCIRRHLLLAGLKPKRVGNPHCALV